MWHPHLVVIDISISGNTVDSLSWEDCSGRNIGVVASSTKERSLRNVGNLPLGRDLTVSAVMHVGSDNPSTKSTNPEVYTIK